MAVLIWGGRVTVLAEGKGSVATREPISHHKPTFWLTYLLATWVYEMCDVKSYH